MSERKLLSQAGLVCILCLFLVGMVRAQAAASGFGCEIYLGEATGRTLLFGVAASAEEVEFGPFPPNSPAGDVYFLGRYDETDMDGDSLVENYFKLSDDVRFLNGAKATTWTLISNKDTRIKVTLSEGSQLPAGSLLMFDGQPLAFDTSIEVRTGERYVITYQAGADVRPVPEQPENMSLEMVKASGYSISASVSPQAVAAGKATAHDASGKLVQADFGKVAIEAGTLTYTLPEIIDSQVASVRIAYRNVNEAGESVPAVVVIRLTDGIAFRCLSSKSVTLEPGNGDEGKNATLIKYEIVVPAGFEVKDALALSLRLPAWKAPEADPFPYTADVKLYADQSFGAAAGEPLVTASAFETSFALPVTAGQTYYLGVSLVAASKAESNYVFLDAMVGDEKVMVKGPFIYIKGTATLDFDGNDMVDTNDAIMFYNFVNQQGVDIPELFDGPEGLAMLTDGIVVEPVQAEACRLFMQSVPAFLDFDEDGTITTNDAIMLYNFANQQGVDIPELFDGPEGLEMLTDGIVVEPQSAETARDKFQQLVR